MTCPECGGCTFFAQLYDSPSAWLRLTCSYPYCGAPRGEPGFIEVVASPYMGDFARLEIRQ